MASLDVFIVTVAFADIAHDFRGESLSNMSWVLNGYTILYAALLVPLGRLADRYGRKNGFLLGLGVFTAASAACAASSGLWMLVAFRGVQALGAAALTPTSLGLLLASTPGESRARAVRIWAATGALASAAGPVIGGLLVQLSWRWVFLVNLPVGASPLVDRRAASARFTRPGDYPRTPDLVGSAQLAIAIGTLSLGLVKGSTWGWTSVGTLTCFGVTVAGTVLFWLRSARSTTRCRSSNPPCCGSAPSPGRTSPGCSSQSRSARCCCRRSCGCSRSGTTRPCAPDSRWPRVR